MTERRLLRVIQIVMVVGAVAFVVAQLGLVSGQALAMSRGVALAAAVLQIVLAVALVFYRPKPR